MCVYGIISIGNEPDSSSWDVKYGHTGRGVSGALYLQTAVAGVRGLYEGCGCAAACIRGC